ncbi:glycoside hydrolase family 97 protein [Verrucomicrobia bacterium S94]|nr:glycoside hydrolase family 97 protein [Verrucomicrobia bacterium S94]
MKTTLTALITALAASTFAQQYFVQSPGGNNTIEVYTDGGLAYQIRHNNVMVTTPSPISITIDGKKYGETAMVADKKERSVDRILKPVVKEKRAEIRDRYNELELTFKNGYGVIFRAFDNGVAYRLFTELDGEVLVEAEEIVYNFTGDHPASVPVSDGFFSHYERGYTNLTISALGDIMACLPSMVTLEPNLKIARETEVKVAITEADLDSYPGFYLVKGAEKNQLVSTFPRYPKTTYQPTDRDIKVGERENFIARTAGTRAFPWRLMVITDEDRELINNTLVYQLGPEQAIENTDWIKPGKVAWDWYNMNNIEGVDFEAGINTETYKFYIDFASQYGLEYIILDEGWYDIKTNDLLDPVDAVDVQELIRYGKKKNVGIILWVTWTALEENADTAYEAFAEWGAKGIKVDFMQRDDQPMVDFYSRCAAEAAKYKLLVDFHGSYKPAGLRRAYPNVITREGVRGLENNKWEGMFSNPEYCLEMPFLRMLAGPVDYTPGAMANAQKENYNAVWNRPMSLGTRAHQFAMYVVYESPLQMLADAPSSYLKEPEVMEFLAPVPSVWDETVVLDAKYSDYVVIARRNGDTWYVGAMTDWTPRDLDVDFSFLPKGKYTIDIWQDGANADKRATDYKKVSTKIKAGEKMNIHLAPGGGWAAIIRK